MFLLKGFDMFVFVDCWFHSFVCLLTVVEGFHFRGLSCFVFEIFVFVWSFRVLFHFLHD